MATQIGATYLQHDHGGRNVARGVISVPRTRCDFGGGVVGIMRRRWLWDWARRLRFSCEQTGWITGGYFRE